MPRNPLKGRSFFYAVGDSIEADSTEGLVGRPAVKPQSVVRGTTEKHECLKRYILDLDAAIWIVKAISEPMRKLTSRICVNDGVHGRKVLVLVEGDLRASRKRGSKSGRHTGVKLTTKCYTFAEVRKQLGTVPASHREE